jgi:uncharacterized membrane protein
VGILPDAKPMLMAADAAAITRRSHRVIVLLGGILVLSLADLFVTLAHLQSVGMLEANPIAAFLIRTTGSAWVLGLYKMTTVAVCIALLYRLRRYREGELAAWCAVTILAGLSLMWHAYSEELEHPDELDWVRTAYADTWLHLD